MTDRFDKQRLQYCTYNSYLKSKNANQYYNLGYMDWKVIIEKNTSPDLPTIQDIYINFAKALFFNPHDIDAKKRQKQMCEKWNDPDGTNKVIDFTSDKRAEWDKKAKNDIRYGHGAGCGICPPK
tara:strand:- start:139 stop:510 length:372 start_codon:yes stop_codon:yes gene_type:complete